MIWIDIIQWTAIGFLFYKGVRNEHRVDLLESKVPR